MLLVPKAIYRFSAVPKISRTFMQKWKNTTTHMGSQGTPTDKTILKRTKTGGLTLPGFKTYYKTIVITTALT